MDLGLDNISGKFERLARLPAGYRLAMVPLIAALVIGAYGWFLWKPAREKLKTVSAQQMQLQRKLNEVRAVAANLEQFEQEIQQLDRKLQVALRQLPNSKELPVLLTDVSTLGKNAGLDMKVFRPRDEVKRDFYAEVPIEIEFSGRFHDVATFFDEVSRLPRIVNVGMLDIAVGHEDTVDTVLNVKGEARTFRFLEDAGAGAAQPAAAAGRAPARGGRR